MQLSAVGRINITFIESIRKAMKAGGYIAVSNMYPDVSLELAEVVASIDESNLEMVADSIPLLVRIEAAA